MLLPEYITTTHQLTEVIAAYKTIQKKSVPHYIMKLNNKGLQHQQLITICHKQNSEFSYGLRNKSISLDFSLEISVLKFQYLIFFPNIK